MAEVLVLGATSMVGSHFVAHSAIPCTAAGRQDPRAVGIPVERFAGIDLTDLGEVASVVGAAPEPVVINFAAATEVDAVEAERPRATDPEPSGRAWTLNARMPEVVATVAQESGRFFVQLSTDFVFDGHDGPYDETARRSPYSGAMSWYGWTKSEGERRAALMAPSCAVVRIAYPYRASFPGKIDFARRILARYRDGTLPPLYVDQQISPTWVPDVTRALAEIVRRRAPGTLHVASPQLTTPFEFASELVSRSEGRAVPLREGRIAGAPADPRRAPRPVRGGLRSNRAADLGLEWTGWKRGIAELLAAEGTVA